MKLGFSVWRLCSDCEILRLDLLDVKQLPQHAHGREESLSNGRMQFFQVAEHLLGLKTWVSVSVTLSTFQPAWLRLETTKANGALLAGSIDRRISVLVCSTDVTTIRLACHPSLRHEAKAHWIALYISRHYCGTSATPSI
jgi:hypothetical protein